MTGDRIIEIARAIPREATDLQREGAVGRGGEEEEGSLACKGVVFAYSYNMQQVQRKERREKKEGERNIELEGRQLY